MIPSAAKTPKILFVNPRFPRSLWGFQGIHDIVGVTLRPVAARSGDGGRPDAARDPRGAPGRERGADLARHRCRRGGDRLLERAVPPGARAGPRSSGAAGRWSSWAGRTRRSVRSASPTARSTSCSTARPRSRGPSSAGTSGPGRRSRVYKQVGNIDMQTVAAAAVRPHPEGRLPLLLRPDDPGLPVRVRVLRHHHHRWPHSPAEVDPAGPQGDRDHRRARRQVRELLRRQPHRQPEVSRSSSSRPSGTSAAPTAILSSSRPR